MRLECSSQRIPRAVVLGLLELNCDWLKIPTSQKSFHGLGSQTLFSAATSDSRKYVCCVHRLDLFRLERQRKTRARGQTIAGWRRACFVAVETLITTNMDAVSNVTTEQTALTGEKQDDSDDEDKNNVDLGVAGLPRINFSGSKNEFETINLDGDGDDEEEEDPSDRDLSDDKRKKKYRKKKKKNQPLEDLSDSSSDDERTSSRKRKETETDPVNTLHLCSTKEPFN